MAMLFLNSFLLILPTIINVVVVLSVHQTHTLVDVNDDNSNGIHTIPLGSEATFHWRYDGEIILFVSLSLLRVLLFFFF